MAAKKRKRHKPQGVLAGSAAGRKSDFMRLLCIFAAA
jgi:hypothetical protein